MNLTGKWKYVENYVQGEAEGELYLKQEGNTLSGRLVFTDHIKGEKSYMIQEFLTGRIEEQKVYLDAQEYDIIYSEFSVVYELDRWLGILVEETLIKGSSLDDQGVAGHFQFVKVEENVSDLALMEKRDF